MDEVEVFRLINDESSDVMWGYDGVQSLRQVANTTKPHRIRPFL